MTTRAVFVAGATGVVGRLAIPLLVARGCRVTAVINLATHIPAGTVKILFRRSWRENDRLRREGSAALVKAAIESGVTRFVQESFAPVYEGGGQRWIDEGWPQRPTSLNETVLDAERSAGRFTAAGGAGAVLRFAGFYGPDEGKALPDRAASAAAR